MKIEYCNLIFIFSNEKNFLKPIIELDIRDFLDMTIIELIEDFFTFKITILYNSLFDFFVKAFNHFLYYGEELIKKPKIISKINLQIFFKKIKKIG